MWKRSRSWSAPGPPIGAALITRAPVRRATSAQKDGPSSPWSWTRVRPRRSLSRPTSSSDALTKTPASSVRRRRAAVIRSASATVHDRGDGP